MNNLTLQVPLNAAEQQLFGQKFRSLDPESLGIVTGEAVRPVLSSSGLSAHTLSLVWALCDSNNNGFLNYNEFSAALRIIGHLQQYPNLNVTKELYARPAPTIVNFNGTVSKSASVGPTSPSGNVANHSRAGSAIPAPVTKNLTGNLTGNVTGNDLGASDIPLIPATDVSKFSQLFDRSAGGNTSITGDKAKDIFTKANLPNQLLGEIWALCDRNASGALDKNEFVMAMYLIQLGIAHHPCTTKLPTILPQQLWQSINFGISKNNTGSKTATPIQRQSTISRVSQGAFSNASADWSLAMDKKKQFDTIFDTLDKQKIGHLGSSVLVPFFLSSKLNQETLATIWDLADIHNNAEFSKTEFAIAMFLIQKKNAGVQLPDVIPNQLLQSPALGITSTATPTSPLQQKSTIPNIQQNTTVPPHRQQIAQNSTSGSLNELMALNDSFVTPSTANAQAGPTPLQPNHSAQLSNSVPVGKKITQPTIQEENESFNPNFSNANGPPSISPLPQTIQRSATGPLPVNSNKVNSAPPMPAYQNRDIYASNDATAAALSTAQTELANVSNQVNSLTQQEQAAIEKKKHAEAELKRVNDTKTNLEAQLTSLRASHNQNLQETDEIQSSLATLQEESQVLQQQLNLVQGNHDEVANKLTQAKADLEQTRRQNEEYQQQIETITTETNTLQNQLSEAIQSFTQEQAELDANSALLEQNKLSAEALEQEVATLQEKIEIYVNKQKELDDYKTQVESQHAQLENTYKELEAKHTSIADRQKELETNTKNLEQMEASYHINENRLKKKSEELKLKEQQHEQASAKLAASIAAAKNIPSLPQVAPPQPVIQTQQTPISNSVSPIQPAPFSQTLPNVSRSISNTTPQFQPPAPQTQAPSMQVPHTQAPSMQVSQTQAPPTQAPQASQFVPSQTITTTTSLSREGTPSQLNNQPFNPSISAVDYNNGMDQSGVSQIDISQEARTIPGQWSPDNSENMTASNLTTIQTNTRQFPVSKVQAGLQNMQLNINESSDDENFQDTSEDLAYMKKRHSLLQDGSQLQNTTSEYSAPGAPTTGTPLQSIPQNFALNTDFTGKNSNSPFTNQPTPPANIPAVSPITPTGLPINNLPNAQLPAQKSFDDAFTGLQATVDDQTAGIQLEETGPDSNLEAELQNQSFTGAFTDPAMGFAQPNIQMQHSGMQFQGSPQQSLSSMSQSLSAAPLQNVSTPMKAPSAPLQFSNTPTQAQPTFNAPPVPGMAPPVAYNNTGESAHHRSFSADPKSLAIEELSGMGFTHDEARAALERSNWDLDTATNHLLDSA